MACPNCPLDPPIGQSITPDASLGRVEVKLHITESPEPGWIRLWNWLLAPSPIDDDSQGSPDEGGRP